VNLSNAIDQLPEGYKEMFILHDVEGYEHKEIAKILGCSIGNSKSQLFKARVRLRKLLQEVLRSRARETRIQARSACAGAATP
jgi:RNA polymerase sigma-70 factor (ECF subfamily)